MKMENEKPIRSDTNEKIFEQLVKYGYKVIKLNEDLTPVNTGYTKPDFTYETVFREGQNYGLVGGSKHKTKDDNTGYLMFLDFDVKESFKDSRGIRQYKVIPEAKAKLEDIKVLLKERNIYYATTKTDGLHIGFLSNENIPQGVSLYSHQNVPKLRVDTRTAAGYIVAIAPNYIISSIPEVFDRVMPELESFMFSLGFAKSNKVEGENTGSLSPEYKRLARKALDNVDANLFPALGTDMVGTHDCISFWVMSCKTRRISLEQTTEKIMEMLSQIETSKDTVKTEREIKSLYETDYDNFELKKVDSTEPANKLGKENDLIDKTALVIMSELDIVTNRSNNEILIHNGKTYIKDSNSEFIIKERTEEIIENCSSHDRVETVNKIKVLTGADLDDFDKDPNVICIDSGILDISTLELKEHTPDHLSTILIPVTYQTPEFTINDDTIFEDIERNLKDTIFWKFLKNSFTVDEKFREQDFQTVLEIFASFFIKKQIDEKAFMFLGGGENGKSVMTEYITEMLGDNNCKKISVQKLADDKFVAAGLQGKLANIYADLEADELKHTGVIKNITSGEGIDVQHKYADPFTLHPFCNLLFSCNRFPKVYDQSQGFFRRWIIVEWGRNFEQDIVRDPHLKTKLREDLEEKSLVFSSIIHLSRLLVKKGVFSHSKGWKETQKLWNANADPLDDFVNTCITDSEGNKGVRETYHFYKEFMITKGERPLGIGQFGRAFREYFEQEMIREGQEIGRMWLNIDFRIPKQTFLNEKEPRRFQNDDD